MRSGLGQAKLSECIQSANARRRLEPIQPLANGVVTDGKKYLVDFCSNDYLGLRLAPEMIQQLQKVFLTQGLGSGGSPLLAGYRHETAECEQAYAEFLKQPRALLLNSGYVANLAVFSSAFSQDTHFFIDKFCHASIYDGLTLGQIPKCQWHRFPHGCMQTLEKKLHQYRHVSHKVIVSEGIFSMTGLAADMAALKTLKARYQTQLIIDDAHAIGVIGSYGQGHADSGVDIHVAPLGKAFALQGAVVAANATMIEHMVQKARPYIYSTAMLPAIATMAIQMLTKVKHSELRRQKLKKNIAYFRESLPKAARFTNSQSAIQFWVTDRAQAICQHLQTQGFYCRAIGPPTVPAQMSGIRFVLSASHQKSDLQRLLSEIKHYV